MQDAALIESLGIIVVTGALFAAIARGGKMPSIVAYLAAGVVIGPVLRLVRITDTLELISHVGIALLLFLVGLELSLTRIRDVGRVAVVAGIGQIVFTALGGFALAEVLGFSLMESLFLALALTLSSTVIVVKLLGEKGELGWLYGRISVGIFLVQDLVAIVMLTFLAGLAPDAATSPATLALGVASAFGGMALLLLLALAASRYILPRPFAWMASSGELLFIAALAWCFLMATLASHLGLSLEIGAFLAGIALAQLPFNQELHRRVHPLMNFFIAVFFVTLGIKMEVHPENVDWVAAGAFSLFVIVGNPLIFMLIISRMGYSIRTAFLSGLAVAQISEFSFVLVALGLTAGLIGSQVLSLTALVGLITFAVSSYMIHYNHQLYRIVSSLGVLRLFKGASADHDEGDRGEYHGHVIVIGMNTLGRELVARLSAMGERVVAVDKDPAALNDLPCEVVIGSVEYLSLLHEIGMPSAKLVVSALRSEETNDLLAYRCSVFRIPCAIHAIDLSVIDNLLSADTTYLMIPKVDGIKLQTRELKRMGVLRE